MLKVLYVFGTRPEAIKLAPLIQRMARHQSEFAFRVCVTAQHRQLLDQALQLFEIIPDYDLNIMEENQSVSQVTSAVLQRLDPVLQQEVPEWVVVQGDTTTTMAAALAAYYRGAKVGHVEAGLRTGNKWQPYPEEINRRMTGLLADLHFSPTEHARRNLLQEGIPEKSILVTGNTVIDALHWVLQLSPPPDLLSLFAEIGISEQEQSEHKTLTAGAPAAPRRQKLILVTVHRRENFGEPLEQICEALRNLASHYGEAVRFLFLVHPNPNVSGPARRILAGVPQINLIPPLSYAALVHLIKRAHLIVSDSGGLQEEAPSLGKPVLVLRQITERPEAIEAGIARVIGVETARIITEISHLVEDDVAYRMMVAPHNPFGDGQASERIMQGLRDYV